MDVIQLIFFALRVYILMPFVPNVLIRVKFKRAYGNVSLVEVLLVYRRCAQSKALQDRVIYSHLHAFPKACGKEKLSVSLAQMLYVGCGFVAFHQWYQPFG